MEMERGHMSIKRGVSWTPGGLGKPFSATQTTHTPGTDCNAPWETAGFNKDEPSRKASKSLFFCYFSALISGVFDEAKLNFEPFVWRLPLRPQCSALSDQKKVKMERNIENRQPCLVTANLTERERERLPTKHLFPCCKKHKLPQKQWKCN